MTKKTIILSDLRAEIGPHKMLDLEKVADRVAVDSSYDLRLALNTSRLRICSQGVVSRNAKPQIQVVEKIIEKVIEKHHHHETEQHHHSEKMDEAKMIALMRQVMAENKTDQSPVDNSKVLDAVAMLSKKLESIGESEGSKVDDPVINPEKLAEMQLKSIEKMAKNIETGNKKTRRRVILKNTRLGDLADELS